MRLTVEKAVRAVLHGYSHYLSPLLPAHCRFYPSCSHYAQESLARYGLQHGSYLAVKRVLKCHPWHPGGFDPVPDLPNTPSSSTPSGGT